VLSRIGLGRKKGIYSMLSDQSKMELWEGFLGCQMLKMALGKTRLGISGLEGRREEKREKKKDVYSKVT
jgi:hypothetical protein